MDMKKVGPLLGQLPAHKQAAVMARTKWLERARPKQVPPTDEDWFVFLALSGRGWGKTAAGSQEVWWRAAWQDGSRIAVVAPTAGDLRRTCFEGESGILRSVPKECLQGGDQAIAYNRSLFELRFENGSVIQGYSAAEPDRLRGPNHSAAWADELSAWTNPEECWDMLIMTLRIGDRPQVIATTTPRPVPIIRNLMKRSGRDVLVVRGSTFENEQNLAPTFVSQLRARYAGTRLGRQELEAEILEDVPGALWTRAMLDTCQIRDMPPRLPPRHSPDYGRAFAEGLGLTRVVVGVDPSGAKDSSETADETGIVVAGIDHHERGYVLEDVSGSYSPDAWGKKTIEMYDKWGADRIVAESNFGGGMVQANIRSSRATAPVVLVTASRGKAVRAEPVAALYEQNRVIHCDYFPKLEEQLASFTRTGFHGDGSPDRADSLVWCLTELMLNTEPPYSIWDLTGIRPPGT